MVSCLFGTRWGGTMVRGGELGGVMVFEGIERCI